MPYRATEFRAGHFYHIYNRGHNRRRLFLERANYLFFLRRLRTYFNEEVRVIAYCLMPNHYHIVVELLTDALSPLMQRLSVSYAKAFNKRYDRRGSVFEGPFQAKLVETTEYLVHLSRYVHLNPVLAKLVDRPEDWEFSSFREYIDMRKGTLPSPDVVLDQFVRPESYRAFLDAYRPVDVETIEHLMFD